MWRIFVKYNLYREEKSRFDTQWKRGVKDKKWKGVKVPDIKLVVQCPGEHDTDKVTRTKYQSYVIRMKPCGAGVGQKGYDNAIDIRKILEMK